MKTLLISESRDVLTAYADFFKSMGYENLCYRWLLKAMDNLEEIQPDVVFINASDYPRHWKTIVQHIRASGFCNPVILLAAEYLDEDDQAKARFLGIYCVTSSIEDEQTRQKIRTQLNCAQCENPSEQNAAPEPHAKPQTVSCSEAESKSSYDFENTVKQPEIQIEDWIDAPENALLNPLKNYTVLQEETVSVEPEKTKTAAPDSEKTEEQSVPQKASETFTFIHPVSKIEITGPLLKYEHPLLFFRPYNKTESKQLRLGKKANGIINRGGEILNVSVQVQGLDDDIAELCILI